MEHLQDFDPVKRFDSLYRRHNFRPLIQKMMWGVNLVLFAAGFGAVMYCLRIFN